MKTLLYIFIGGGTGSICRYFLQLLFAQNLNERFPFGTFLTNLIGCLLIGLFYSLSEHWNLSQETRLALTTGLCGGFTTFSTFSNENLNLIRQGDYPLAILYITGSLFLGVIAVGIGYTIGNKLA